MATTLKLAGISQLSSICDQKGLIFEISDALLVVWLPNEGLSLLSEGILMTI